MQWSPLTGSVSFGCPSQSPLLSSLPNSSLSGHETHCKASTGFSFDQIKLFILTKVNGHSGAWILILNKFMNVTTTGNKVRDKCMMFLKQRHNPSHQTLLTMSLFKQWKERHMCTYSRARLSLLTGKPLQHGFSLDLAHTQTKAITLLRIYKFLLMVLM